MTLVATTITSMLSKDVTLIFKVKQRPVVVVATQNDAASLSTVASIGATIRVVLYMTKVH